jgi:fructose-1,6-bisphosphatase/sedoheptulose 1,7-bisphosphatase-like protein
MKLYNFSHPLIQEQLDDIAAARDIASGDINQYDIKVQLDLNAPLRAQISDIADLVTFKLGEEIYVILPGQAAAAVVLTDMLQSRGAQVNIIRFGQQSTPTGTIFPFKEIVRLQLYLIA